MPSPAKAALRIATIYVVLGVLWVVLSDRLLLALVGDDPNLLTAFESWKGAAFVALSGLLVYLVSRRALARQTAALDALARSEERYRSLVVNLPVGVYYTDAEGTLEYLNPRGRELTGIDPSATPAGGWAEHIRPEDTERVDAHRQAALAEGAFFVEQYSLVRDGFEQVALIDAARPQRDGTGTVIGWMGTLTDVTATTQARSAADESEARFQTLVEHSLAGVFVIEGDSLVWVNDRMSGLLGLSRETLLAGESITALFRPDDATRLHAALAEGAGVDLRLRLAEPQGSVNAVEIKAEEADWAGGRALVGTMVDMSASAEAEWRADDALARFERFMNASPAVTWIRDEEGRYLHANAAFEAAHGLAPGQWRGERAADLFDEDVAASVTARDAQALESTDAVVDDYERPDGDGVLRHWQRICFAWSEKSGGRLIGGMEFDQTPMDTMAHELVRIGTTLEAAEDGLLEFDAKGIIGFANPAFGRLAGLDHSQLRGQPLTHLDTPLGIEVLTMAAADALATHTAFRDARTIRRQAGSEGGDEPGALELVVRVLEGGSGGVVQLHDTTRTVNAEARAARLSTHDALTGLPTRSRLEAYLDTLPVDADTCLAVACIDVDALHRVNEQFGHRVGDEVLKACAKSLARHRRRGDIVARHSGDAFVLVLKDLTGARFATAIVEDLVQRLCALQVEAGDAVIDISVHAGVAILPDRAATPGDLLRLADQALSSAASRPGEHARVVIATGEAG